MILWKDESKLMNRKGVTTVFLMVMISSLLSAFTVFLGAAKAKSFDAAVDSMGEVWAQSVIGSYDRNLYSRFGIMGYLGENDLVEREIDYFAKISFSQAPYAHYRDVQTFSDDYSLCRTETFKEQIRAAALMHTEEGGGLSLLGSKGIGEEPAETGQVYQASSDRKICNESVWRALPSYGRGEENWGEGLKTLLGSHLNFDDIFDRSVDTLACDRYVRNHFYSARRVSETDNSFFRYEKEYIICGKNSDMDNLKGVKKKIILAREGMNLLFLETDPGMQALTLEAATALAGPAAPAAQQALMAAWALLESENDYLLLINGKKVPFHKDTASWATHLEGIGQAAVQGYIDPGNETGQDYEDYLSLFLFLLKPERKYGRMMDLVQIDMKYCYYSDFLLKDYFTGVRFRLHVNGKDHEFEDHYAK